MKKLIDIIEGLKIGSKTKVNKNTYKYHPKSRNELISIIDEIIGIKKDFIDFNDIDVSEITDMEDIFSWKSEITHIDISFWDVSNVKNMRQMFCGCKNLEKIGNISIWNTKNLEDITGMFYGCKNLKDIGDLNNWDYSKIKSKQNAFSSVNKNIIPKWS